jgi:hypothetical protein
MLVTACSIRVPESSVIPEEEDSFESGKSGLKTLNLRLDEVAHIRSALTKAELEGIADGSLRNDIERGKVRNFRKGGAKNAEFFHSEFLPPG